MSKQGPKSPLFGPAPPGRSGSCLSQLSLIVATCARLCDTKRTTYRPVDLVGVGAAENKPKEIVDTLEARLSINGNADG